jgi:hypothetical protein
MSAVHKSAAGVLAEGPLAGLLQRARLLGRLTAAVSEIERELTSGGLALPQPHCALQGTTLIVTVSGSSHAAKLRQSIPRIQQALGQLAPEVTGIRIRLQPGGANYPMSGIKSPETPTSIEAPATRTAELEAALRFADDLAAHLHESPLRQSALRLQAALRARQERG